MEALKNPTNFQGKLTKQSSKFGISYAPIYFEISMGTPAERRVFIYPSPRKKV